MKQQRRSEGKLTNKKHLKSKLYLARRKKQSGGKNFI
jgi:hypothetical protein